MDYFNGFALCLIIGYTCLIILPDATITPFGLWGVFLLPAFYLTPFLIYLAFFRGCLVLSFHPNHVEVRDRRDIAWMRWGTPALGIPYAALGGFYVHHHSLFAILDGVPCKIFARWPMRDDSDFYALGRVMNVVAASFGAQITNPVPERGSQNHLASGKAFLARFRHEHHINSFKGHKRATQVPSVLSGKLLEPGETLHYFFRPDPAMLVRQKGPDRALSLKTPPFVKLIAQIQPDWALALTTTKIVRLYDKDHYWFSFYDQVQKVETRKSTLTIRLIRSSISIRGLPDDCPLEEVTKFIARQQSFHRELNKP